MCCCQHSGGNKTRWRKKKHPAAIPIPNRPSTWKKKETTGMVATDDPHISQRRASRGASWGPPRSGGDNIGNATGGNIPQPHNPLASRCFSQLVVICVPGGSENVHVTACQVSQKPATARGGGRRWLGGRRRLLFVPYASFSSSNFSFWNKQEHCVFSRI